MNNGFNNDLYIKLQSEKIKEKMSLFKDRLYLEFGGKLFDDYHATRVLPGFKLDSKIRLLQELKEKAEVILCINASDIEKNKVRSDNRMTYDAEVLRLINNLTDLGIPINSVVITLYKCQPGVEKFKKVLELRGVKTYIHTPTKGYPTNIDTIVSEEGYGCNSYIETTKPLVIVTAPGASSGKLATCLSQLYHEYKLGYSSGYAKFETFPVWDLPLKHPINVAYEAATADISDKNMIDYFHLEKYNVTAVNYNRDIEVFPILKNILNKIIGYDIYSSPTDMGVNTISKCITDMDLVKQFSKEEIIRRYYKAISDSKLGIIDSDVPNRIKILLNEFNIDEKSRDVVPIALQKAQLENKHVVSLKLPNGKIITGKETAILTPLSSVVLNALKELTNIPDKVYLLSSNVLEPILKLKHETLHTRATHLNINEVLIALSICSTTNSIVEHVLLNLNKLFNCEAHSTYIINDDEYKTIRSLNINLTCEPVFYNEGDNSLK